MTNKELEKRIEELEDLNKILWGLLKNSKPNDDGGNMAPLYPYDPFPNFPGVGFDPWALQLCGANA